MERDRGRCYGLFLAADLAFLSLLFLISDPDVACPGGSWCFMMDGLWEYGMGILCMESGRWTGMKGGNKEEIGR
jgi:hypothetical protein